MPKERQEEDRMDPRVQAMADVLVNYCVGVKPGDWAVIETTTALSEPLVAACVESVLKAGGNPTTSFGSEMSRETFLRTASQEQLRFLSPLARLSASEADVRIAILAPANTRALAGIDSEKLAIFSKTAEPIMETSMRRTFEGTYRWTGCQFPTSAAAQDAGMSLRDYDEFVFRAGL